MYLADHVNIFHKFIMSFLFSYFFIFTGKLSSIQGHIEASGRCYVDIDNLLKLIQLLGLLAMVFFCLLLLYGQSFCPFTQIRIFIPNNKRFLIVL